MRNQNQEQQYNVNNTKFFLTGMLLGGLAGAATMLLLAPQSGQKTIDQIQNKSIELRNQATDTLDGAMTQVRRTAQQLTDDVREKSEELQQRGRELLAEQGERLSTFVESAATDIEVSA